jgi:hypothetical protein
MVRPFARVAEPYALRLAVAAWIRRGGGRDSRSSRIATATVFELRVVGTKPALTSCLCTAFSASRGAALLVLVEAVAQTRGAVLVGGRCGSAVGDVSAVCGGVTAGWPVSGRHGGEVVTVGLGEVVGHHQ